MNTHTHTHTHLVIISESSVPVSYCILGLCSPKSVRPPPLCPSQECDILSIIIYSLSIRTNRNVIIIFFNNLVCLFSSIRLRVCVCACKNVSNASCELDTQRERAVLLIYSPLSESISVRSKLMGMFPGPSVNCYYFAVF